MGAAHAGTALSAALGMCAARDQRGTDENVVAIFLAMRPSPMGYLSKRSTNVAQTTKRFIGILNDNEWSIAKNVGAISAYLNKLITHPSYNKLARDFEKFLRRLPKGEVAIRLAHKAEEGFKSALTEVALHPSPTTAETDGRGGYGNSLIFEEMGVRYLGPIDGHNLPLLISTLEFAKSCDHPIVVHVLTKKGKGFEAALKKPREIFTGLVRMTSPREPLYPPKWERPPQLAGTCSAKPWLSFVRRTALLSASTAAMPSGTSLKILEKGHA